MNLRIPNETVGERLRRLRAEQGLTQRALACDGVSHAHISRIEAGSREPSVKALRQLAQRLGVSADYLERGVEALGREQVERELADAELALRLGTDAAIRSTLDLLRREAEQVGDSALLARANALAGLAAAREGDQAAAIALLEAANAHPTSDPIRDPDLFVTLGTTYLAAGREADAVALYERCLAGANARIEASRAARVRFATHLSYALADGGRVDRAAAVLAEAAADPGADPYSQVRLDWGLARLDVMLGRSDSALAHMENAIALLAATEDDLQRGRAELMCGEILAWEGEDERAAAHVAECAVLETAGDADDIGALRAVEAVLAARRGDYEQAETLVLASLQVLGESEFGRPLACLALALVHAEANELPDARHAYEIGLASLERAQMWPQAASFCRVWAAALDGRLESAEAALVRQAAAAFEARTPRAAVRV